MDLTIYDDGESVTPFWRRIPRFFLFPLHPGVILRVTLLSCLPVLAFGAPGAFLLLPLLAGLWLASTMMGLRHAYLVLEQTSLGRLSPDQYPPSPESGPYKAYKQLAVLLLMAIAVSLCGWLAGAPGLVLSSALAALALPASIMSISVTDSVTESLNPARLLHIVSRIGWPYLALCFFLFSLIGGSEVLLQWVSARWPPPLIVFAAQFVCLYFTYIMYNMMGYVLYQYHRQIGLAVSVDFAQSTESANRSPGHGHDDVTEQLGRMVAAGKVDAALEHAYEDQRANPYNLTSHERYHRMLQLAGDTERLLVHGRRYLTQLVRQEQVAQALELYERCVRADAQFQPEEGHEAMMLATGAHGAGRDDLVLALLRRFDRRHPGHRDIPNAYMLSAEVLCERYREDARARQILQILLTRYPTHELAERARRYLNTLDKLRTDAPNRTA